MASTIIVFASLRLLPRLSLFEFTVSCSPASRGSFRYTKNRELPKKMWQVCPDSCPLIEIGCMAQLLNFAALVLPLRTVEVKVVPHSKSGHCDLYVLRAQICIRLRLFFGAFTCRQSWFGVWRVGLWPCPGFARPRVF